MNSIRRQHTTFEFKAQVFIWTSRLTDSVTLIPQVMHAHWQPTQHALQSLFQDGGWVISYLETIFTLESRVDLTQTDRIVLPLDYIKRRLVNMRDEAKTDTVLSQLQQVADNILDERHQDKNREGHFRGHSTQTADTWKTYFLIGNKHWPFFSKRASKCQSWPNCRRCPLKPSVTAKYKYYLVRGQRG